MVRGPRRRAVLAHAVVVLLGLLVLLYPFTVGASPSVTCRGTAMRPGDVCAKAGDSGTQTYEQRAADVRNARPVIAVGGLLLTGFGVVLLAGELRRRPGAAAEQPR
ncbi:hypothetical protein SAMN04488543_0942 [Friedmanniella luteola]|uniref:Uncharacterized protein n=1 Tax=Friedmanniella luteola TaxID=546871 RepID=A0A1H1NUM0_9ACTN|nr:hypothetical protein SAMN04488543_0942 [Friedmanniella luteola]